MTGDSRTVDTKTERDAKLRDAHYVSGTLPVKLQDTYFIFLCFIVYYFVYSIYVSHISVDMIYTRNEALD